ncbi:Hypothetical predicted protein [Podarcis lilfordi]|uniref:Uncharacterized protein n=1 Tax=Podarcis lilfordi TaxID=74358 RepID=A0AA35NV11_9SAUR|nr:Hypothetical predicted protein [Podarcis lilfordi]
MWRRDWPAGPVEGAPFASRPCRRLHPLPPPLRPFVKARAIAVSKRDGISDARQYNTVQGSPMVIRTWDSCQIPDGSSQLTSWLATVKKILGLFYFIFVGDRSRRSTGYTRLHISFRFLK